MKKWDLKKIRFKQLAIDEMTDKAILLNLYITQAITLTVGFGIIYFQKNNPLGLFNRVEPYTVLLWGGGFALLFLALDLLLSRWVPEEVTNDGGVNGKLFGNRSLWHIALISIVVAICEEILFRGAVQHVFGPYWTSILFAAIHVRYLQHWLMTGLVFSVSYGLGWIYLHTGTLWTPIFAHLLIDFVMGCILRYRGKTDAFDNK
jgi:membrane protease YdiL (CAAX protease family)